MNILDREFGTQFPSVKSVGKFQPTDFFINKMQDSLREIGDSNDGAIYYELRSVLYQQIEICKYTSFNDRDRVYKEITGYLSEYLDRMENRYMSGRCSMIIDSLKQALYTM